MTRSTRQTDFGTFGLVMGRNGEAGAYNFLTRSGSPLKITNRSSRYVCLYFNGNKAISFPFCFCYISVSHLQRIATEQYADARQQQRQYLESLRIGPYSISKRLIRRRLQLLEGSPLCSFFTASYLTRLAGEFSTRQVRAGVNSQRSGELQRRTRRAARTSNLTSIFLRRRVDKFHRLTGSERRRWILCTLAPSADWQPPGRPVA